MKNYRFLKITQDEETELYTIEGILDADQWVTIPHTIAEDVQAGHLYMYVGDYIAEKATVLGVTTFDDDKMQVTMPLPIMPFPEPTTNFQTNLIEAQIALLIEMAEKDTDLSTNQVSWINDDLDFIEVAYKRNSPDGDRQQQYADEITKGETQYIDFKEAMYLLNTRIENSL